MSSALSRREVQVLALGALGLSTKQIATELGISKSTVLWHRKQGLARQTAAVASIRMSTPRRPARSAAV